MAQAGLRARPPTSHPLQKMFQCPYFFFDIVYIHHDTEDKEEDVSWKVSRHRRELGGHLGHPTRARLSLHFHCELVGGPGRPLLWQPREQTASARHP